MTIRLFPKTTSLHIKLMLTLATLVTLTVVSVTFVFLGREQENRLMELEGRADRLISLVSHSVAYSVWNVDPVSIDDQLESLFTDPEIVQVSITAIGYGKLCEISRLTSPIAEQIARVQDINFTTAETGMQKIGEVRIVLTRELVEEGIKNARRVVWMLVIVILVILYIATFILLRQMVSTPVKQLELMVNRIALGDLNARAPVASGDELGRLAGRFNIMADRLYESDLNLKDEILAKQLKEAELQKVTMAVEQAGEIIFITDVDGTIQYVNPAFTAVSGYSQDEAIGRTPRLLKSGCHDKDFYGALWDTISAGSVWHGNLINRRKDGSLYTEESTISAVKDSSGRILNYVAVKRDITQRKRMEEDLISALEEKNKLISELFHRTNNNIQLIQALLYLRFSVHPELPLAQYVDDVTGQIQSMAQAQQLLSKGEHLSRIDLAEYLPLVVQQVQDRYPERRERLSVFLELQSISILLDSAVPLGLVVTELINNSFIHAFPGGNNQVSAGKINVTCASLVSGEIEVRVSDDGIGWCPGGGSSEHYGGGLDLAAAMVEQQLGGTIKFDKAGGTTCILRFRDNRYEERV